MGNQGGESIRERYDWSETDPSTAIVSTLAELEGTSPDDLDFVLYDHVDPDALDELVPGKNGSTVEFRFRIEDFRVDIDGDQLQVARLDGD